MDQQTNGLTEPAERTEDENVNRSQNKEKIHIT